MSKNLKLTDREWRVFSISSLFDVFTGANIPQKKLSIGIVPRISATDNNNGIDSFYTPIQSNSYRTNNECISVSFLGSVFYQPYEASYDMKIHSLRLKGNKGISEHCGLFVATELRKQCSKFSYGNQVSSTDLPKQKLLLPIQADGMPDWKFMEAYMKQEEERLIEAAREKLENQLLEDIIVLGTLKNREWREFVFGDVFDIQATSSGIDKKKLFGGVGNVPYLTRTDNNNGIDGFVEPQEASSLDEGNVITIGLDTQTVFYQESSFYTGQNIQVVRHKKLDKYNALFIIRAIKILVQKFSWGSYGATLTRLRRGKLFLPIQSDGTPDWEFMSAFMKQVEQKTLSEVLRYFKIEKCNEMLMGGG